MGGLCGGTPTTKPGVSPGIFGKPTDEIIIYGDYFQAETRTIAAALEYSNVSYRVEEMVSNFDQENETISIDQSGDSNIMERRQSISSMPSEQPKSQIDIGNTSSIVLTNYEQFLQYLVTSRPKAMSLIAPINAKDADKKEIHKEFMTKLLWFQNVLRPVSVKFIRSVISLSKD